MNQGAGKDNFSIVQNSEDMSSESLTRVPKPLRCTSLHQTFSAGSPSAATNSLPDSFLSSMPNELNDDTGSAYSTSSDDASMQSDSEQVLHQARSAGYLDMRRNSSSVEKRQRRTSSSSNNLKLKNPGLSLTYTSPKTTAYAINEVVSRRGPSVTKEAPHEPTDTDRVSFLAELPEAIARARKVHYRRDALLPKTKSFNRVLLSLKEGQAPFETDVKKEATLASILKGKATSDKVLNASDQHLDQFMSVENKSTILDEPVHDVSRLLDCRAATDTKSLSARDKREHTLFTMEDINTSIYGKPQTHDKLSPKDQDHTFDSNYRSGRCASRSNKRKNEDSRYGPYMFLSKRRAVSPSPSSPSGSPGVKGSIFRIEDLTL